jgi:integrase
MATSEWGTGSIQEFLSTKGVKKYRAFIRVGGQRKTKVFSRKTLAQDWLAQQHTAKRAEPERKPIFCTVTLRELLTRYRDEVTVKKDTWKSETNRLNAFIRDYGALCDVRMDEFDTEHLNAWLNARLAGRHMPSPTVQLSEEDRVRAAKSLARGPVSEATAARDVTWLRAAIYHARDVRKWKFPHNAFSGFDAPQDGPPRTQVWNWRQIRLLWREAGYRPYHKPQNGTQEAMLAFHLALRTSLRSGEILRLGADTAKLERRIAIFEKHKTRKSTGAPKIIPLFRHARRLLAMYAGEHRVFTIDDEARDALFRKVRDRLGLQPLDFHDTRATCLTHMARRMPVEDLAKVSGHKDIKMLVNTYYRITPEQLAAKYEW